MRAWIGAVLLMFAAMPAGAQGTGTRAVVVELFTSQGCSSCPPADAHLHELAKRDDVVALSLHVDYWDYIGWKDVFGHPRNTRRQHGYAQAGKRRMVYTPQMVVQGQKHVVGNHPKDVAAIIRHYKAREAPVDLSLTRKANGRLVISAQRTGDFAGPVMVHLVHYQARARVDIKRGENRGRSISYANVVRDWKVVGQWNGQSPLHIEERVKGNYGVAVIIQRRGFGPILAAAKLR